MLLNSPQHGTLVPRDLPACPQKIPLLRKAVAEVTEPGG
jgi:hypothetical protein